jgi:hypothetical protein
MLFPRLAYLTNIHAQGALSDLWLMERNALPFKTSDGMQLFVLSHDIDDCFGLCHVYERRWETDKWRIFLQAYLSHDVACAQKCLSNIPVVGTRLKSVVSEKLHVSSGEA